MYMKLKTIALTAILAFAARSSLAQQSGALNMASPEKPMPADAKTSTSASDPSFRDRYPRYKLEAGDLFDIAFELSPEFNQTVTVQPDGFITLRGVGDVHVAGQTVPELTQTIRAAYDKILHEPLISITLKDFQKPFFIADGQVGRPGKYELRGDTTLTEAIAMAGGFQDSAKHSQVLLFRRVSDQWTSAKVFNVKKMEHTHDLQEDPLLHSGDMLFVPKNRVSKIKPWLPTSSVGTMAGAY
jgi:polysaccharide biosynthesis/export protein